MKLLRILITAGFAVGGLCAGGVIAVVVGALTVGFVFHFCEGGRLQLRIFRQLFSKGLQITDYRGQSVVFWSFDIERLTARLRLFGFEIHQPHVEQGEG